MSEASFSLSDEQREAIEARLDAMEGDATEALHRLFQDEFLPPSFWYGFACDCAERALARDEASGVAFAEALREAIEGRRRQLRGEIDEAAMAPLVVAARDAALAASARQEGQDAASSAADACSDVRYAIRAAAWAVAAAGHAVPPAQKDAARLAESQWQVQRCKALLSTLHG